MNTVTKNSYSEETHPWEWQIPPGATKLLIGTFPTDIRNRKHDFFYCSSTNRLWEVLSSIADHPMKLTGADNSILERKNILEKLKLGLTDMGRKVYRQQGCSNDHSLFPIEFMDIIKLLNDHPSLTSLLLTGNLLGNSSLNWFNIYCSLNNIKINLTQLINERMSEVLISGKKIKLQIGYSTSRLSRIKTQKLIDDYKLLINKV